MAAALVIKPFGPLPNLLKDDNPWRGFHDEGPLLTVLRAQKVDLAAGGATCKSWMDALAEDSIGKDLGEARAQDFMPATSVWEPWRQEELELFEKCSEIPCDVKLDAAETRQMAATPKPGRAAKFKELVLERLHRYQKTQERKEYEFPGDPVEPWKYLEAFGLRTDLAIPPRMKLEIRRIDFFPGKVKTMHQVLDTRIAVAPDGQQAVLWRRDAYTDHYFDSWGEWAQVSCDTGFVTVTQGAMLELDLIKKTDLFSKLMRSKMRGAVEDAGKIYHDAWFARIQKRALAAAASATPAASPTPIAIPSAAPSLKR